MIPNETNETSPVFLHLCVVHVLFCLSACLCLPLPSRVYWACKEAGVPKAPWNPPASFERSTNKFWVHPHKVEAFVITRSRVLVALLTLPWYVRR